MLFMNSTVLKYLIISLIFLPVFFINIKSSHDWGDDFAQYIHQAKNITKGIAQNQTGYIYNPHFPLLGPPSYPIGFPLLLAPVYSGFGNSISHFNLYISFFLFSLGLLMFHFLHKYYSALISTLLIVVFVYNPWTLNFKIEIVSDIPFTLLLLLCVCRYQTIKPFTYTKSILLILFIGFLISIRNIGLVFVFAVVLDGLLEIYRHRHKIKQKQYNYKKAALPMVLAVAGLLIYLLLNKVIFNNAGGGMFPYAYLLNTDQLPHFIQTNLHDYMAMLRSYFEPLNDEWQFVALFSGTMIFAFIILGMIKKMNKKFDFMDGLTLIYLFAIIVYPYSNAGFRFLLPLIPYLLYYSVQGLQSINIKLNIKPNVLAIMMTVFILFSYKKGLSEIFKQSAILLQGPQETESIEAFNYIIKNTPANARFNFIKPRALSLYTNRNAMSHKPNQQLGEIEQSILHNEIQYILINNDISDDSLKAYVKIHESEWEQMWNNTNYFLYQQKQK